MQKKLLLSLAILMAFAPIQANMFEDLAENMKTIYTDAKEATTNLGYKLKKNTWDAPILGHKHGGKIATSAAAAVIIADYVYSWYHNKKIKASATYQDLQNLPENQYKQTSV